MTTDTGTPAASTPAAEPTDDQIWKELEAEEAKAEGRTPTEKSLANDAFAGDPENAKEEPSSTPAAPASDEKPEPTKEEVPAASPDPWADAPPELRAAHHAQVKALENASSEQARRSIQGRIDAYTRRLEERKAAAAKAPEPLTEETAEDPLAALETDYPEIAEPFKKKLAPLQDEISRLKSKETAAQEAADRQMDEDLKANEIALEQKHPGIWDMLAKNGAAFGEWIVDQPLAIRRAAVQNKDAIVDLDGAIRTIEAFKAHLSGTTQPPVQPASTQGLDLRAAQLAASTTPKTTGGKPTVSGIPKDGDPDAIWKMMQDTDPEEQKYRRA